MTVVGEKIGSSKKGRGNKKQKTISFEDPDTVNESPASPAPVADLDSLAELSETILKTGYEEGDMEPMVLDDISPPENTTSATIEEEADVRSTIDEKLELMDPETKPESFSYKTPASASPPRGMYEIKEVAEKPKILFSNPIDARVYRPKSAPVARNFARDQSEPATEPEIDCYQQIQNYLTHSLVGQRMPGFTSKQVADAVKAVINHKALESSIYTKIMKNK